MKKKSLKINTILSILKSCSSIVISLVLLPYVSRVLKPENVGKVQFAAVYVNYFLLIATLGIGTHAIRECANVRDDKKNLGRVASEIFSINVISMLVSLLFLACFTLFVPNFRQYGLLVFIEGFKIILTVLGTDWINTAEEDYKYITITTLLVQVVALISTFLFVRSPSDYVLYAAISTFSAAGVNVINIFYCRRYCKIRFTLKIPWKKHIIPIMLLFSMMLSQTIMNSADVTMLGLIKNDYEVGLYSTAYKVVRAVASIVQAIALVIIPRLSILFQQKDFENANILLRKVLLFNISLGIPCFIGVEMLARDIIMIVGGYDYISAVPVLRLLMISFLFSLVGGSFIGNAIMIPMKKEKYYMIACIVTAITNVLLNVVFIPLWGASGAAVATSFNDFVLFIVLYIKMDKRIRIDNLRDIFLGPLIGGGCIILCCLLANKINNIIIRDVVSIITSVLIYFGVLYLLKNSFSLEVVDKAKKINRK